MLYKFIICYQLKSSRRELDLQNCIKRDNRWARLMPGVFIVDTNKNQIELRDELINYLETGERLYVGSISAPAAWIGMLPEVTEWIKKTLNK